MRALSFLALILIAGPVLATELPAGCGSQAAVPDADRLANTIRWTTASEQDNFGYDVYRGLGEEGPFDKLNATPVLGHGTTDETSRYSYRDASIDPCVGYWYYVESISTGGDREIFTPVVFVKPKIQPETATADAEPAAEAGGGH